MNASCLILGLSLLAQAPGSAAAPPEPAETLSRGEDGETPGRLVQDPKLGPAFAPADGSPALRLAAGMRVRFNGAGPSSVVGLPPFRVELGLDQRISGQLVTLDDTRVVLGDPSTDAVLDISRSGIRGIVQRAGEALVLEDGFETLDGSRWKTTGEVRTVQSPRLSGKSALEVPAGGRSASFRLPEPFASGRLEVGFHDDLKSATDQKWSVELVFKSPTGPETVRARLGWADESLSVESQNGPTLAVQRLSRAAGWHRLAVRFSAERCEISVDGNELAHGKGPGGPLSEVRFVSAGGSSPPAEGLAAHLDDLRLVRSTETVADFEIDATQDEVRLSQGDQIFGSVREANDQRVVAKVDGSEVTLPWSEISGLYFKREPATGASISGLLVRAEWRSSRGRDPDDLDRVEGALASVSPESVTVATAFAGDLKIPRNRLTTLQVLGRGVRILLDNSAHHLGDSISTTPPRLDPPQPEGGVLERSFSLDPLPEGPVRMVLDVVQVVGEAPDLPFSSQIKKGELRTNVSLNGTPFDYLNHYINSRNETPERIRVVLPRKQLRRGRNVVRLEQVGIASDPNYLDDLGVLGVAIEYDAPSKK